MPASVSNDPCNHHPKAQKIIKGSRYTAVLAARSTSHPLLNFQGLTGLLPCKRRLLRRGASHRHNRSRRRIPSPQSSGICFRGAMVIARISFRKGTAIKPTRARGKSYRGCGVNVHRVTGTGWLEFPRPKRRKAKARQCFERCTCNRV